VPTDQTDAVRQLMMRYLLLLSAAEGLAVGMLESLQKAQQGIRPEWSRERIANVADTLAMIQSWAGESDGLWQTLGIERRQGESAGFDPAHERRKPRVVRALNI
jgi:hypothetical protein